MLIYAILFSIMILYVSMALALELFTPNIVVFFRL